MDFPSQVAAGARNVNRLLLRWLVPLIGGVLASRYCFCFIETSTSPDL